LLNGGFAAEKYSIREQEKQKEREKKRVVLIASEIPMTCIPPESF